MHRKNTIFDFQESILFVFSISVIFISIFCMIVGDSAKGISTIYSLGSQGISISVLIEFFALSVIITIFRWLFFTDIIIKNLSKVVRCILMYVSSTILGGVFSAIFGWFPVNQVTPWLLFFGCFFICSLVSTVISIYRDKVDNKKMQDALNKLNGED